MPTLPLELYYRTIWSVSSGETEDLKTLSLVCRAFRLESQKNLFHALTLRDLDSIDRLKKVQLWKLRHPRLASYLREVTVRVGYLDATALEGIDRDKLSLIGSALLLFQDQIEVLNLEMGTCGEPRITLWGSLPEDLRAGLLRVFYRSPLKVLCIEGIRSIPLHWLMRPSASLHELQFYNCTASGRAPPDQVAVMNGAPLRIQRLATPVDLSGLDVATGGLAHVVGKGSEDSWLDAACLEHLTLRVHQQRRPLPVGNQPVDLLTIMPPKFLQGAENLRHLAIFATSVSALFSPDYFKILHKNAMSTLTTMTMRFYQFYSESIGSICLNFFDTLAAFPDHNFLTKIQVTLRIELPIILDTVNGTIRPAPLPPAAEWDRLQSILTAKRFPALERLHFFVSVVVAVGPEVMTLLKQSEAWRQSRNHFVTALFYHMSNLKKRLAKTHPTLVMRFGWPSTREITTTDET